MGSVSVSTKYALFHFCLLTVPYHSKFQEIFRVDSRKKNMLGFGSNLGFLWKCVKWSLLPFLFTSFDLPSSKSVEKYWADSENKVSNYFWPNFYPIYSLSNSNHFTSAKKCRRESCIIDFMSAKMEFASAIFKNCIFPIIQLKGVANRLSLFQNLSNHTNRSSMG